MDDKNALEKVRDRVTNYLRYLPLKGSSGNRAGPRSLHSLISIRSQRSIEPGDPFSIRLAETPHYVRYPQGRLRRFEKSRHRRDEISWRFSALRRALRIVTYSRTASLCDRNKTDLSMFTGIFSVWSLSAADNLRGRDLWPDVWNTEFEYYAIILHNILCVQLTLRFKFFCQQTHIRINFMKKKKLYTFVEFRQLTRWQNLKFPVYLCLPVSFLRSLTIILHEAARLFNSPDRGLKNSLFIATGDSGTELIMGILAHLRADSRTTRVCCAVHPSTHTISRGNRSYIVMRRAASRYLNLYALIL